VGEVRFFFVELVLLGWIMFALIAAIKTEEKAFYGFMNSFLWFLLAYVAIDRFRKWANG
tara:strand:- start:238 stop:414 length:177 start_codon:yes stop_codon:yes gene_type:complete